MDLEKLREQLIIDEGVKYETYLDHLSLKTVGIVANMMFNLGRPRYSKFRKHIQAVMDGNWKESANQMRDSRWHKQVPNRAERLCKRMEEIEV
jgi:GH24 family phage-related lysozyme (muramidase)